jgi:hypothetical protein
MPSIRQELETTRTARWYRHAHGARRAGAWAERVRDYAALRDVLAGHAAVAGTEAGRGEQPPIQLAGLLKLVAQRAHYAGAEPVYRRYRDKQQSQPILRWAGPDPVIRPSAAFLAEARIAAFWPYREGAAEVADAFDMTRVEWAAAYLRALAAWAADNRPLAACHPVAPPPCVPEDMAVIAGAGPRWAAGPTAADHAARLSALAGEVVRTVLRDSSITPLGAYNTVRDEVRSLLSPPPESLADQVLRAVAELTDRMTCPVDGDAALEPGQARRLHTMLGGLSALLAQQARAQPDGYPRTADGYLREA